MFTASHNPAQYNGIKLCRAGAAPVGQDTGLAEIRDLAEARRPRRTTAQPGHASRSSDVLPGVRRVPARASSTSPASGRCTVVVDAGNGMGGHTVPTVLDGPAARRRPAVLRARRHLPQPRGQPARPGEPASTCRRAVRERGRRHRPGLRRRRRPLLRRSTSAASRLAVGGHRAGRRPRAGQAPGRDGDPQPDHLPGRAGDRPRARRHAGAHPGRPLVHQGRDGPRPARSSAASTRRTTTSATSGAPTPACSPRCTCSPRSASRTGRCRELAVGVRALRRLRRDQQRGRRPGRAPPTAVRRGVRGPARRRRSTTSTG